MNALMLAIIIALKIAKYFLIFASNILLRNSQLQFFCKKQSINEKKNHVHINTELECFAIKWFYYVRTNNKSKRDIFSPLFVITQFK